MPPSLCGVRHQRKIILKNERSKSNKKIRGIAVRKALGFAMT
jgi:hypothetical protein